MSSYFLGDYADHEHQTAAHFQREPMQRGFCWYCWCNPPFRRSATLELSKISATPELIWLFQQRIASVMSRNLKLTKAAQVLPFVARSPADSISQ
jgi:hypothetical protein